MKKGCKSFLLLSVMIFSITFLYFTDTVKAVPFEYDSSSLTDNIENLAQYFTQMSDAELEYFIDNYVGMNKDAFESFKAVKDEGVGEFVSVDKCNIKEYDDYVKADTVIHFKNNDVKMSVKFQNISQSITPVFIKFSIISKDSKVSMGSKMATAGLNTLMGMGTVFVVLIFLSLIISLFGIIPAIQSKMASKNKTESTVPVQVNNVEEEEELVDDLELIAVITAAIAASENGQTDGFVVRSIKRRPQNRWKNA